MLHGTITRQIKYFTRERERIGRRKKLQFDGVKLTVKLEDVKIGTPRLMSYGKTGTYDPLVLIRDASNRSSKPVGTA